MPESITPDAAELGVTPEMRLARSRFTDGAKIFYRDIPGSVVPKNLVTPLYPHPWWAVPVNLDGDSGYIHFINYSLLTLVGPEPEVIEAKEEYHEAGIYRDKSTGKIWANTSTDRERFYCLNDSYTWPIIGKRDHWVPLYEKVWNAA